MINVNFDNILSKNIGLTNGISERKLNKLANKYNPLVKEVFRAKNKLGYDFLNLPDDTKLVRKIKKYVSDQKKYKWENIVVLGIGGSSLGTIAVRDALLSEFGKKPKLFVVDNIDPTYTSRLLSELKLSKTLFIVISKSGATTEPMVLYGLVKDRLIKKFPTKFQNHLLFITDPKKGLLRKIAKKDGTHIFDVPTKVGGRFSVLSSVGLVPCAFAGIDVNALLKGAREMKELIKKSKGLDNPALLLAISQFFIDRKKGKPMTVLMPYSNQLFRVGDWYRQLLAESIGKNNKTGPTPINALGTTDQHSQLQLYAEGPNNKLIIFMRLLKHEADLTIPDYLPKEINYLTGKKMSEIINAACKGTSEALAKSKRPNLTLEVSKVDAKHLGALFMLFEFQVAILGLLYKVDAFNQPGVENSKIITKSLLSK